MSLSGAIRASERRVLKRERRVAAHSSRARYARIGTKRASERTAAVKCRRRARSGPVSTESQWRKCGVSRDYDEPAPCGAQGISTWPGRAERPHRRVLAVAAEHPDRVGFAAARASGVPQPELRLADQVSRMGRIGAAPPIAWPARFSPTRETGAPLPCQPPLGPTGRTGKATDRQGHGPAGQALLIRTGRSSASPSTQ